MAKKTKKLRRSTRPTKPVVTTLEELPERAIYYVRVQMFHDPGLGRAPFMVQEIRSKVAGQTPTNLLYARLGAWVLGRPFRPVLMRRVKGGR